jgi:signal transduction histidine kinase
VRQVLTNLALNARDAMPDGRELRFELSRLATVERETPPVSDMPPGA